MSDEIRGSHLSVVTLEPKKRELDNSEVVKYLETMLEKARAGEMTGMAVTWVSASENDTTTWWGAAPGSGHLADLASGIARLAHRYQNEAYGNAEYTPLPKP